MQKHLFFDLDNTLTPSRALMKDEHVSLFTQLCSASDVVVVTGGSQEQIAKQIPIPATGNYFMLSQQGNFAVHKSGEHMWHESVTPEQEAMVRAFGRMLTDEYVQMTGNPIQNEDDIFENRGSQFATSLVGFHAPNDIKYAADPDQSIRRKMLVDHTADVIRLHEIGIDVMPAGTTTFDFILRGKHKGFNITRLLHRENWLTADSLYFGDALFTGGNDETVIGVIPTHPVSNPDDTFSVIAQMLS